MPFADDGGLIMSPEEIKDLADKYEVPVEQMMIAVAAIDASKLYWGDVFLELFEEDSIVDSIVSKVFGG